MVSRPSSVPARSVAPASSGSSMVWTSDGFRIAREYRDRLLVALGVSVWVGLPAVLPFHTSNANFELARLLIGGICAAWGGVSALSLLADTVWLQRLNSKFRGVERIGILASGPGKREGYVLYGPDPHGRLIKSQTGLPQSVDQIIGSSFAGKWFDVADKGALFAALRTALS